MCTARPVYHRPISLTRVKAKVDWKVRSMNSTVAPFSGLTLPSRPHAWTPPFCLGFFRRKTHNHISSRSAPFSSSSSTFSSLCELISFLPPLPPTSKNERMPFVYATGKMWNWIISQVFLARGRDLAIPTTMSGWRDRKLYRWGEVISSYTLKVCCYHLWLRETSYQ